MSILSVLAKDSKIIPYRPELREIAGSVTAAILLRQLMFWCEKSNKPFFKFKEPCKHKMYKPGDSWCEELGFSRKEFDTALRHIGKKKTKAGLSKGGEFVTYWTSADRLTYYRLDTKKLEAELLKIYLKPETVDSYEEIKKANDRKGLYTNDPKSLYLTTERDFTKSPNVTLHITENTTENTTEKECVAPTPKKTDQPPFLSFFFNLYGEKPSYRMNNHIAKLTEQDKAKIREHLPAYIASTSKINDKESKLPWRKSAANYITQKIYEEELTATQQPKSTYSAPKVGLGGY